MGKFVIATLHTSDFQPLADITQQNKIEYCKKYGYRLVTKVSDFHNVHLGFEKAFVCKDIFQQIPECEWIFYAETDMVITNMDIKLEDIVKDEMRHVVHSSGPFGEPEEIIFNFGACFVRNTPEGRKYIDDMIAAAPSPPFHSHDNEQTWACREYTSGRSSDIVSVYPARVFNSFPALSAGDTLVSEVMENGRLDFLGEESTWKPGHFLIHLAGPLGLEKKVKLARLFTGGNVHMSDRPAAFARAKERILQLHWDIGLLYGVPSYCQCHICRAAPLDTITDSATLNSMCSNAIMPWMHKN